MEVGRDGGVEVVGVEAGEDVVAAMEEGAVAEGGNNRGSSIPSFYSQRETSSCVNQVIGCFSALCLHVSPFGALFRGIVLSSLLGSVRVVCINMKSRGRPSKYGVRRQ